MLSTVREDKDFLAFSPTKVPQEYFQDRFVHSCHSSKTAKKGNISLSFHLMQVFLNLNGDLQAGIKQNN